MTADTGSPTVAMYAQPPLAPRPPLAGSGRPRRPAHRMKSSCQAASLQQADASQQALDGSSPRHALLRSVYLGDLDTHLSFKGCLEQELLAAVPTPTGASPIAQQLLDEFEQDGSGDVDGDCVPHAMKAVRQSANFIADSEASARSLEQRREEVASLSHELAQMQRAVHKPGSNASHADAWKVP